MIDFCLFDCGGYARRQMEAEQNERNVIMTEKEYIEKKWKGGSGTSCCGRSTSNRTSTTIASTNFSIDEIDWGNVSSENKK